MEGGGGEVEATRPWQQLQQPGEGGGSGLEGQGGCGVHGWGCSVGEGGGGWEEERRRRGGIRAES